MIYNLLVALLFTYYTFYCTRLFQPETRNNIKDKNKKLDEFRNLPFKTLEQQKEFLNLKQPITKWKFDKSFWIDLLIRVLFYFVFVNIWLYIFNSQKLEWQLWHTVLLYILLPLFVNGFLDRFNLEQSDFWAIFRGSKKNGNNRPKSKRLKTGK